MKHSLWGIKCFRIAWEFLALKLRQICKKKREKKLATTTTMATKYSIKV